MSVGEGPAVTFSDRAIPTEQLPFAYCLMRHLDNNGAVVGFSEGPFRAGACELDVSNGIVQLWTQMHATEDTAVEALGEQIMQRFGKLVTFGGLVIPHGPECVTWSRSGGVFVRHVVSYLVQTDELVQRWDVLVRKTQ